MKNHHVQCMSPRNFFNSGLKTKIGLRPFNENQIQDGAVLNKSVRNYFISTNTDSTKVLKANLKPLYWALWLRGYRTLSLKSTVT